MKKATQFRERPRAELSEPNELVQQIVRVTLLFRQNLNLPYGQALTFQS